MHRRCGAPIRPLEWRWRVFPHAERLRRHLRCPSALHSPMQNTNPRMKNVGRSYYDSPDPSQPQKGVWGERRGGVGRRVGFSVPAAAAAPPCFGQLVFGDQPPGVDIQPAITAPSCPHPMPPSHLWGPPADPTCGFAPCLPPRVPHPVTGVPPLPPA